MCIYKIQQGSLSFKPKLIIPGKGPQRVHWLGELGTHHEAAGGGVRKSVSVARGKMGDSTGGAREGLTEINWAEKGSRLRTDPESLRRGRKSSLSLWSLSKKTINNTETLI